MSANLDADNEGGSNAVATGGQGKTFPAILRDILDDERYRDIVRWGARADSGHGHFVICDLDRFTNEVLVKFYKCNLGSFIRQLNAYGFKRERTKELAYFHPLFIRSRPDLIQHINRRTTQYVRANQALKGTADVSAEDILAMMQEAGALKNRGPGLGGTSGGGGAASGETNGGAVSAGTPSGTLSGLRAGSLLNPAMMSVGGQGGMMGAAAGPGQMGAPQGMMGPGQGQQGPGGPGGGAAAAAAAAGGPGMMGPMMPMSQQDLLARMQQNLMLQAHLGVLNPMMGGGLGGMGGMGGMMQLGGGGQMAQMGQLMGGQIMGGGYPQLMQFPMGVPMMPQNMQGMQQGMQPMQPMMAPGLQAPTVSGGGPAGSAGGMGLGGPHVMQPAMSRGQGGSYGGHAVPQASAAAGAAPAGSGLSGGAAAHMAAAAGPGPGMQYGGAGGPPNYPGGNPNNNHVNNMVVLNGEPGPNQPQQPFGGRIQPEPLAGTSQVKLSGVSAEVFSPETLESMQRALVQQLEAQGIQGSQVDICAQPGCVLLLSLCRAIGPVGPTTPERTFSPRSNVVNILAAISPHLRTSVKVESSSPLVCDPSQGSAQLDRPALALPAPGSAAGTGVPFALSIRLSGMAALLPLDTSKLRVLAWSLTRRCPITVSGAEWEPGSASGGKLRCTGSLVLGQAAAEAAHESVVLHVGLVGHDGHVSHVFPWPCYAPVVPAAAAEELAPRAPLAFDLCSVLQAIAQERERPSGSGPQEAMWGDVIAQVQEDAKQAGCGHVSRLLASVRAPGGAAGAAVGGRSHMASAVWRLLNSLEEEEEEGKVGSGGAMQAPDALLPLPGAVPSL